ncbi:enoyl-CoA hydratase/isomerase family protein [Rhizobium sp. TH2]|uniref:enoyl-CoA hydratase/isomerase family protein n=1 Tax=Rhizobium sp. TH2 TaxID=2775403 RepID=UPI0021572BFE|nr:enoyl-CoA hydratase/isomerase family protein [Rhizobium sp. TH2]UVC06962.1 enoyl-CoA hydratase/isomerase family protein [Rhizobium sp. TH2]
MNSNEDISIRVEGRVGRITLTRPKALNAVNQAIVDGMYAALKRWETDPGIALVLVDAEGEKAFSAGGDLASIYNAAKSGDIESANSFWRDEYRLNAYIDRYPKPYVAVMDGIVMGGGVGVSGHGSHRIVTDNSMVAMPECAIGLITDVGGSYLLARAPGHMGEYLGLTGTRMKGEDAIYAGFADIYVHRARLEDAKAALVAEGDVSALSRFEEAPPPSALARDQQVVDRLFAGASVPDIMDALRADASEWALKALNAIEKGSPLSAIMILSAVRDAGSLERALRNEYRFVSRVLEHGDFVEGIRAIVIDKDRNPTWRYKDIDAVPAELIALMRSEAEGGDPDFLN